MSALVQLTSAPVSYRSLKVNKFSIMQIINGFECKKIILYSTWLQISFLILLIYWGFGLMSEMSGTILGTTVRPTQSLNLSNLRLRWCPCFCRPPRWLGTACPAHWALLRFNLWSISSIHFACVQIFAVPALHELPICHFWASSVAGNIVI